MGILENGRDDFLSAREAATEVGVSYRVMIHALRDGDLQGRNLKGRRGWVTTRAALVSWIEQGNLTATRNGSAD